MSKNEKDRERERSKKAKRTHTLTGLERAPRTRTERERERERGGCEIGGFFGVSGNLGFGKSVFEREHLCREREREKKRVRRERLGGGQNSQIN